MHAGDYALLLPCMQVLMPHSANPVSIRIGIHTGPCVSGLIGTKLPKWTVLGGTINTAGV